MKNMYRIVRDNYAGYEVQKKRWWFPFWKQVGLANTYRSIERAKEFIERDKNRGIVVYHEESDS